MKSIVRRLVAISLLVATSLLVAGMHAVYAQSGGSSAGSAVPVICEWADSLVGQDLSTGGQRSFIGNVRFRQGDVTVHCDRAVQVVGSNVVDLFGNVVVRQGTVTLQADAARYDGTARQATGSGGVWLTDRHHTLTARRGTYSTDTRQATFEQQVCATNDTVVVWSHRAWYDRNSGVRTASGRVLALDSSSQSILQADSLLHDPTADSMRAMGHATVWVRDSAVISVQADTIAVYQQGGRDSVEALGNVRLHHPSFAATAATVRHQQSFGSTWLVGQPVLWADSSQLTADTIEIVAPNQRLQRVVGRGMGLLAARSDSLYPDRIDQVLGDVVVVAVTNDTIRSIEAHPNARSITWRWEGSDPQGVAMFASDSLSATVVDGGIDDVLWLEGVAGEVVPERLVVGKEGTFNAPAFQWHATRPRAVPLPELPELPSPRGHRRR